MTLKEKDATRKPTPVADPVEALVQERLRQEELQEAERARELRARRELSTRLAVLRELRVGLQREYSRATREANIADARLETEYAAKIEEAARPFREALTKAKATSRERLSRKALDNYNRVDAEVKALEAKLAVPDAPPRNENTAPLKFDDVFHSLNS